MVQILKISHIYRHFLSQKCSSNFRLVQCLLPNSFSTVTELSESRIDAVVLNESPELPRWVKFWGEKDGDGKSDGDDDFVLPSLAYWIESYKVDNQDLDVKSFVSDIDDSDVDKVSKILKRRCSSEVVDFRTLIDCEIDLNESLVEQVLRRYSCEWLPAYGFFQWVKFKQISADSFR